MLPTKSINIRIPAHLAAKFEALAKRFGGLPPGTVMRLLVSDILERPLDEAVQIVERQIRQPSQDEKHERLRRTPLNSAYKGENR